MEVMSLESKVDENGRKMYTRKQITKMLGRGNAAIRRAEREVESLKNILGITTEKNSDKVIEEGEVK